VPQENVPPAKDKEVKALLLAAFGRAAGLAEQRLRPAYARLQLWGAAVPITATDAPCVFDAGGQTCRLRLALPCQRLRKRSCSACRAPRRRSQLLPAG
jgi:hypothetical protein